MTVFFYKTRLVEILNFFATTPKGLELLLVEELRQLGAINAAEKLAGVVFSGDIEIAYKACLWSRFANRILLKIADFPAATPEELYRGVQAIQWDEHLNPEGTLNVNFITSHLNITHTLFGAQKVKDAIVDQFRTKYDVRPSVAKGNPDVAIHLYLHRNIASISIDLSGESLHKRGYRLDQGSAPLKENLAAAILVRANWPAIAKQGGALLDPMCGSGTLLVEAAFMAGDIAPGLLREYFGFLGWKKHNHSLWQKLKAEAEQRKKIEKIPPIIGHDMDSNAIKIAFANIERAGLLGKIHVEKQELSADFIKTETPGLLVTNPPYGERLGEEEELKTLYERLGEKLKKDFAGWQAAVFTGNPELGKNMGLRARKHYALFNGPIPCQLLLFDVLPEKFVDRSPYANNERRIRMAERAMTPELRVEAQGFINRLTKRWKHIKRWAERENRTCYRIYDADLPEYAVSIDLYDKFLLVQEYQAPRSVNKDKVALRVQCILAVLPEILAIIPQHIFFQQHSPKFPNGFPSNPGQLIFPPK